MKPIGLTLKDITFNPFTGRKNGELMIVHVCLNCGKISPNRIAGDDNPHSIIDLVKEPTALDTDTYKRLRSFGIELLTHKDEEMVLTCLFGYGFR